MGRALLKGYAVAVYVFLFLPIVVVVAWRSTAAGRCSSGRASRRGGSARPSRSDDHGAAPDEPRDRRRQCAGRLRPRNDARPRAATHARLLRVPIDALAYMTLVTPEIVFGISALIFFVQAGAWVGLESPLGFWSILVAHVVFNTSVVALIVRARFVGMGQTLEEASYDLGAGPLSTFRQVTLPRLAPAILAGGLLAFTFSFDDFVTSFFVAGRRDDHAAAQDLRVSALRGLAGDQRHCSDDPRPHARGDRGRLPRPPPLRRGRARGGRTRRVDSRPTIRFAEHGLHPVREGLGAARRP